MLTVLGELVLPHAGSIWTSTAVGSLATLGIDERNARQALFRLAAQGIVVSSKQGRRARWRLAEHGRHLLETGTQRIYAFGSGDDDWNERWLVVLCSVPEDQRAKRHQLRAQLSFAGFGFLGPGVAISPHLDRESVANDVLQSLDLVPGAIVLRAEAGELIATDELLRRAWDLDALAADYTAFVEAFGERSPSSDDEHVAALIELVHSWRRFPFADPEIPEQLLPGDWPGRDAKAVFDACHADWSPVANGWFERAEAAAR